MKLHHRCTLNHTRCFRNTIACPDVGESAAGAALDDAFSSFYPPLYPFKHLAYPKLQRDGKERERREAKIVKPVLVVWSRTNSGWKRGREPATWRSARRFPSEMGVKIDFLFLMIYCRWFRAPPPSPKILIDWTLAALLLDSSFSSVTAGPPQNPDALLQKALNHDWWDLALLQLALGAHCSLGGI